MAYIEEHFATRLERNARKDELNQTHAGVVIWSNPVKQADATWKTDWIVAYPPQLIETVEELQAAVVPEQQEAVKHDQELA